MLIKACVCSEAIYESELVRGGRLREISVCERPTTGKEKLRYRLWYSYIATETV